jgi:hypothetical protein
MTTQPKRRPVCGMLSFIAAIATGILFYWMYRPPSFLKDDTGHTLFFSLFLMYFCAFGGFVFAVVALARRERYWVLPLFALLLDLALAGFFIWAMLMLSLHNGGRAGR